MLCVERDSLRQEHQATVQNFRASLRDLVYLLTTQPQTQTQTQTSIWLIYESEPRGVCEVAQATREHHQAEHVC